MEKTGSAGESSPNGRFQFGPARMEWWALGVVGAMALLALGVEIGMGMGHVVQPVPLQAVWPADCPLTVTDIKITQAPPQAGGYRAWFVNATVENDGKIPTGLMTGRVDFDDASFVTLQAYRTEDRNRAEALGDMPSVPPAGTAPVFLGGDDRVNTYRKYPSVLEITVHNTIFHFPLPKPAP